jgi:hypothetical protein
MTAGLRAWQLKMLTQTSEHNMLLGSNLVNFAFPLGPKSEHVHEQQQDSCSTCDVRIEIQGVLLVALD